MHLSLFTTICPPIVWFAHPIFLTSLHQCRYLSVLLSQCICPFFYSSLYLSLLLSRPHNLNSQFSGHCIHPPLLHHVVRAGNSLLRKRGLRFLLRFVKCKLSELK